MKNLKIKDIFLSVFSAVLLILSFPRIDFSFLVWIGLIPLMLALENKKKAESFLLSYFCGIIFFAGTLYWFIYVDVLVAFVGAPLLVLYLALYFGLFGFMVSAFNPSQKSPPPLAGRDEWKLFSAREEASAFRPRSFTQTHLCFQLILLPAGWVVLEWMRAHFLTGFGWVSLAHSQYRNLPLIQIADTTGIFGISFLIVMVNFLGKELIVSLRNHSPAHFKKWLFSLFVPTFICLAVVFGYGGWRLSSWQTSPSKMKVAVIQANILQERKWQFLQWPAIMEEYIALTKKAAQNNPELIIWPETAFPGILWEDEAFLKKLKQLVAEIKIPLLFGSVVKDDDMYYNSAFLLSEDGSVIERYDKIHLVPFGEYVPLRSLFPFLTNVVPIGDFSAGTEFTVFPTRGQFSVLICFEDTVSGLSKEFVRRGAQLLINITNDAWFEDTKAPFLHLQSSVFRSIENRRTLIRAANTGVSAFIDPAGRFLGGVEKNGKLTYVSGYASASVPLSNARSFYTRFGDLFVYFCLGILFCGSALNVGKFNQVKRN